MLKAVVTWSRWHLFWSLALTYTAFAELASLPSLNSQEQCVVPFIKGACPSLHAFTIYHLNIILNKIAAGDVILFLKVLLFLSVIWEAIIWLCNENPPTQSNQDNNNGNALVVERQADDDDGRNDRCNPIKTGPITCFLRLDAITKFTAVLVVVGALQWQTFENTDLAGRITNRAYIFIRDIQMVSAFDGNQLLWSFIPVWENGGNTTTKEMTSFINYFEPMNGDLPEFFSRCDFETKIPNPNIVLGPKQPSNIAFWELRPEVLKQFQDGGAKKLYFWGYTKYKDQFTSDQHITRFCFDVKRIIGDPNDRNASMKVLYGLCSFGNCTDEECHSEDQKLLPSEKAICKLQYIPGELPKEGSPQPK
jgi:hypothetical protein